MKFFSIVALLAALWGGSAFAQGGPSGGGPGPVPDPWTVNGSAISYSQGGILIPASVTGGNKGVGTMNIHQLYIDGTLFNSVNTATPPLVISGSTISLNINSSLVVTGGNLGINLAHSNTFTAIQNINLNASSLPTAQTGTALQVAQADGVTTRVELDAFAAVPRLTCVRADGTAASRTTLQSADEICSLNAFGYNGTAVVGPQAAIRTYAAQNWTVSALGTYMRFGVTPNGGTTLTDALGIEQDGSITTGAALGTGVGAGNLNLGGGSLYNNGTAPTGTGGYVRASAPTIANLAFTGTETGANLVTPAIGAATGTSLVLGSPNLTAGVTNYLGVSSNSALSGIFVGQGTANHFEVLWEYNQTVAAAYAELTTFGASNAINIEASAVNIGLNHSAAVTLYNSGVAPTGSGAYVLATSPTIATASLTSPTVSGTAITFSGTVSYTASLTIFSNANRLIYAANAGHEWLGTSGADIADLSSTAFTLPVAGQTLSLAGASSGASVLAASATGGGTATLFSGSDTIAGKSLANGGTNNALTASNGGIVYSDASKLNILAGTVTAGQCLLSGSSTAPNWGSCAGGAAVSSVTGTAGQVSASPTTGAVVVSLPSTITSNETFSGTINFSSTFQIGGNAMTFPGAAATLTQTVVNGTLALNTTAIGSGACSAAQTATATGLATTDVVLIGFNADPTSTTGYIPTTTGMLTAIAYPTANTVNVKVCNNTGASITPGAALTLNWRIVR